jgi:hypothetical protein
MATNRLARADSNGSLVISVGTITSMVRVPR